MKKVLIIGNANTYFRIDYAKNIRSSDVEIDILSLVKCEADNKKYYNNVIDCELKKSSFVKNFLEIKKFYKTIKQLKKYDAIHIHSVKAIESLFASSIKKKCNVLVCTIYGSDIYRVSSFQRFILKRLFHKTDYITTETEDITDDFIKLFGRRFSKKIKVIPFGITQLSYIKEEKKKTEILKAELGIPNDKFVITIGYNATKEQHHLDIINDIKNNNALKNSYYIIPLTYGNQEYKRQVIHEFEESGLEGQCFTEFMPIEEVGKLRVVSDIMIQVQDTDSFSSSMNEYLYAGNVIITGSWLPYGGINEYLCTVDTVNDVAKLLSEIINDYEKYFAKTEGAEKFFELNYSWDELRPKWLALYDAKRGTSNV